MDASNQTQRKPRLSNRQIARLQGLLPMEYRPSELARAIGCHRSTIYECYVPNGCPHRRDQNGYLWIEGTAFAAWARSTVYHSSVELQDGEAYCLRCQQAVEIQPPISREEAKSAILVKGKCPQCRSDVARFESEEEN